MPTFAAMAQSNFERLIQLADEAFDYRSDPDQIEMTDEQRSKLIAIHPATLQAENNEGGPVAWLLVLPTTLQLMERFVKHEISEKELLDLTPIGVPYQAIYLCSALVLEEYRRKGITMRLTLKAIAEISKNNPVEALFVWPFSDGGDKVAEKVAATLKLPLMTRTH